MPKGESAAGHRRALLIRNGEFQFLNVHMLPDGMVALTSCSADEFALETPEGGAFTQSLIRALTSREADVDHDGTVTVDDAYEFIRQDPALAKDSSTHPQKWVWNLPEQIVLVRTMTSVFLCYSRTDGTIADAVTTALRNEGILVWRDISGVPGGAEWRDSLLAAFGKGQALVLLMTDEAMASKWVRRELEFADGKRLPIIPLCSTDITPPDWFELQFGGVQRKIIETAAIDSAATELAATVRAAVLASGQATPERA